MPKALLCSVNHNHDVSVVLLFIFLSFPWIFWYRHFIANKGVNVKKIDRIDRVVKVLKTLGSFKDALAKAQSRFRSSSESSTYLQQLYINIRSVTEIHRGISFCSLSSVNRPTHLFNLNLTSHFSSFLEIFSNREVSSCFVLCSVMSRCKA